MKLTHSHVTPSTWVLLPILRRERLHSYLSLHKHGKKENQKVNAPQSNQIKYICVCVCACFVVVSGVLDPILLMSRPHRKQKYSVVRLRNINTLNKLTIILSPPFSSLITSFAFLFLLPTLLVPSVNFSPFDCTN